MKLVNKNILITGASSGIGYQLTKDLVKEGANLALLARRKNILDSLAEELKNYPSKIVTAYCDVASKEYVKSAFDFVKKEFGHIDMVILNAGTSLRVTIKNFDADCFENIINVNLIGMIHCSNEIIPDFIKRRGGCIVGISSLSDSRGFPRSAVYCASKAGASVFLEGIRIELKKYNVKVINVKPGFVKTPMTEKNEFYMPFLMNVEKASQIIINGIKKEKRIVEFPALLVLGAKFLKLLPDFLSDFLLGLPLPSKK